MREGWDVLRFGDVMDLESRREPVVDGREYPVVGVLGFGRGLVYRDPVTSRTTSYRELNVIGPNRIVYSKLKAFEGAITVTPTDLSERYASGEFPTFMPTTRVLPAFFRLLTQRRELWDSLAAGSKGMGGRRERINPRDFLTISALFPPVSEQRRIVDLVGALDEAIAGAAASCDRAESLWWRLATELQEAVGQGPVKALGDIADISGGLTKNVRDAERADAVEVPYLRVANVLRRRLDLGDVATISAPRSRVESTRLQPGDVLMNEGGDRDKLGRGAVWRGQIPGCTHQNHVFRARLRAEDFSPDFVSAWANSYGQRWFETHGTQTTGIASINKTTLSRFPVPHIPLEHQVRWADLLQSITDQEDSYRAQVERLGRLRKSLLTALLSGAHGIPESYDELMEVAS